MSDTQGAQVKDERGAFDAFDDFGVLMDRHVVDERILEARADFVPVRAVVLETAQDYRIAPNDLDGVVIEHLFADGDDIADDVRIRIPTRPQRIGDDARALAGGDEEEVV